MTFSWTQNAPLKFLFAQRQMRVLCSIALFCYGVSTTIFEWEATFPLEIVGADAYTIASHSTPTAVYGYSLPPARGLSYRAQRPHVATKYLRWSSCDAKERQIALQMVLTTPESIIEEASTQKLLDDLIDESVRMAARRPIMMQFDPSAIRIWRRWRGTVFSETWPTAVKNMIFASLVTLFFKAQPGVKEYLQGFTILWGQLLSVTTFTLTFFLNQSYALWRKCYELSRRLQGRLNDLGLTLSAHAARNIPTDPDEPSTHTPAARQILELIARYVRLFNLLTYSSFTLSHRPILTPRGIRRLVERGLITQQERQVLMDAKIPATQRHNAVLLWIVRIFVEARQAGHFNGGAGFEQQFMEKVHVIRAQIGAIGDELQGRMPLAYAHIVQVLVDVIIWMYPMMAFASGMNAMLAVLGTGLMSVFYQGLFDLAKQFLDPYDNENYGKGDDPISVDTLIAETNAGSMRWMYGFAEQPFSTDKIKEGELFEYLLPVRGYTVEELVEKQEREEAARLQREKEEEEKLERKKEKEREEEEQKEIENEKENLEGKGTEDWQRSKHEILSEPAGLEIIPESEVVKEGEEALVPVEEVVKGVSLNAALEDVNSNRQEDVSTGVDSPEKYDPELEKIDINGFDQQDDEVYEDEATIDETTVSPENAENSMPEDDLVVNGGVETAKTASSESADDSTLEEESIIPLDAGAFDGLEWFNEIGPDGQEYRLSQMLADEVWEDEEDEASQGAVEATEEERLEELIEDILETDAILEAAPGASSVLGRNEDFVPKNARVPVSSASSRMKAMESIDEEDGTFADQTQWDGISQLWGSPLNRVPPKDRGDQSVNLKYDQASFDSIFQLWGELPEKEPPPAPEQRVGDEPTFEGIAQLWNDGSTPRGSDEEPAHDETTKSSVSDMDGENLDFGDFSGDNTGNFAEGDLNGALGGWEWHDEIGPDGKEVRLSQMLADEVYEEEEEDRKEPLTYEEFTKKAADIIKEAQDEYIETEAILNAAPGAYSIGDLDEDDQAERSARLKKQILETSPDEKAEELAKEVEEKGLERLEPLNSTLDVLEMDAPFDEARRPSNITVHRRSPEGDADNTSPSDASFVPLSASNVADEGMTAPTGPIDDVGNLLTLDEEGPAIAEKGVSNVTESSGGGEKDEISDVTLPSPDGGDEGSAEGSTEKNSDGSDSER